MGVRKVDCEGVGCRVQGAVKSFCVSSLTTVI